jgi:hypothetical protein
MMTIEIINLCCKLPWPTCPKCLQAWLAHSCLHTMAGQPYLPPPLENEALSWVTAPLPRVTGQTLTLKSKTWVHHIRV